MAVEGLNPSAYTDLVTRALEEDIGPGDVTSSACVPSERRLAGRIVARQTLVLCGLDIARYIFRRLDSQCGFLSERRDGDMLAAGDELLRVGGFARPVLQAERTVLNFLQHLCGIATLTRLYVKQVEGTGVTVMDTRKTTPGLRALEKYAVRMGGARNHRIGLFDGLLIKENHIRAAGSIAQAVRAAREAARHLLRIEVEVRDLNELDEAITAGAEIVMLDNFSPEQVDEAVHRAGGRVGIEVSGGISFDNIRDYARRGVDFISAGSLTHSAPAADMSMLFEPEIR